MTERSESYAERHARFSAAAQALEGRSTLVSNLRGLSFGGFVIAGLFALFGGGSAVAVSISLVGLFAFVVFVAWHGRIIEAEDLERRWAEVNRRANLRIEGKWHSLPEDGKAFADPAHPYASDLDVFGHGSLFQFINVAHTYFGRATLARMLSEPAPSLEVIVERQEAVRALQSELELRQRLEALALGVAPPTHPATKNGPSARVPPDPGRFLEWAEGAPVLSNRTLLVWASRISPVVTLVLATLAWMEIVPAVVLAGPFVVHMAILFATGAEASRVFQAVSATQGAYLRYAPLFELLEGIELDAPLVRRLRREMLETSVRPSESMRRFQRGLGWFELRHNGMVHPFANLLLLWDVHCVLHLESWQVRAGRLVRRWFQAIGDLEALSSFAGLAHDDGAYHFPEVTDTAACFVADQLAHPLIFSGKRVANDVSLPEVGRALLITGSNMSGKSTLLRAMGLAAVMALAGAPVCASRLRVGMVAVRTSIRVSDSLEHGVSHFYAEVSKIHSVLDAAGQGAAVFFLLDEILHGTNSEERQIGARWVLAELLRRGALGAVSTHDIELCRLEGPLMNRVALHHFREHVQNDAMSFDYTLRPGPVEGGNALRVMRLMGIDVPLPPERAADRAVAPKS